VDAIAFPSVYEAVPGLIEADVVVLVVGRIDLRGREMQIRVNEVRAPNLGAETPPPPPAGTLVVELSAAACTAAVIGRLKEVLGAHAGASAVKVRFLSTKGVTPLDVGSFKVDASQDLMAELGALLGAGAARVDHDAA
jgi:DNA polymerase-3 subunit alpha